MYAILLHLPQKKKKTIVPVTMERGESFFIVFRNTGTPNGSTVDINFPVAEVVSVAKNLGK